MIKMWYLMCKFNKGGPRDTIILYVESGHAPLAVEVPDGVGQRVDAGGGAGAATRAAIRGDASLGVEEEFD